MRVTLNLRAIQIKCLLFQLYFHINYFPSSWRQIQPSAFIWLSYRGWVWNLPRLEIGEVDWYANIFWQGEHSRMCCGGKWVINYSIDWNIQLSVLMDFWGFNVWVLLHGVPWADWIQSNRFAEYFYKILFIFCVNIFEYYQ